MVIDRNIYRMALNIARITEVKQHFCMNLFYIDDEIKKRILQKNNKKMD